MGCLQLSMRSEISRPIWAAAVAPPTEGLTVKTITKVRARTRHPELAKPEYARVYWHHGRYLYRSRRGLPMIVLGTDLGSALFRAKLGVAKQAEKAWLAYIERKI